MENLIQLERGTGEKPLKFLKDAYTILYSSITLLKTGTGLLEMWKKIKINSLLWFISLFFSHVILFAELLVTPA